MLAGSPLSASSAAAASRSAVEADEKPGAAALSQLGCNCVPSDSTSDDSRSPSGEFGAAIVARARAARTATSPSPSLASRATNCRVERTGIHGIPSTTASRSGSAPLSSNAQEAYRAITRQLAVASGNRVNASKAAMRIGYKASSSMRSNGVASMASSVSPCGSGCPLLTRHVPLGEATHDQAIMPPALDVF
jgi:hypothetical protein